MKKLSILCLVLAVFLLVNGFVGVAPETAAAPAEKDLVLAARFENILNHNTVYGDDFYDNQKLVNSAMIMLKNYADEDGFINENIVSAYIKDMYDIDIDINEKINAGYPQKEGYVLLIPRGHSEYIHTVTKTENMGDYILVTSTVSVKTHDNGTYQAICKTRFAESEASSFGYTIISSELIEKTNALKI